MQKDLTSQEKPRKKMHDKHNGKKLKNSVD